MTENNKMVHFNILIRTLLGKIIFEMQLDLKVDTLNFGKY